MFIICTLLYLRRLTGEMAEARQNFGYALNSQVGLAMVGGYIGHAEAVSSESTADGVHIDSGSVAEFGTYVSNNCLASLNASTLISFGGNTLDGVSRKIDVHTLGSSGWEVKINLVV